MIPHDRLPPTAVWRLHDPRAAEQTETIRKGHDVTKDQAHELLRLAGAWAEAVDRRHYGEPTLGQAINAENDAKHAFIATLADYTDEAHKG